MKILWLTNTILPQVAKKLGIENGNSGGWVIQLSEYLKSRSDVELVSVFMQSLSRRNISGNANGISFWGIYENPIVPLKYNFMHEDAFSNIVDNEKPDVVHIWGTEYIHSLEMYNASCHKVNTVISIQGIISRYAKVYLYGLPQNILTSKTLRDFIRKDTLINQQRKYELRGQYEKQLLEKAKYVIGRTEWDKRECLAIGHNFKYFKCEEILRKSFYNNAWAYMNCEKYTIFISQAWYPIKGFHLFLPVLAKLIIEFPLIKVYVAGGRPYCEGVKKRIKETAYGRYLRNYIEQNRLQKVICFLGNLDEVSMCNMMLKSHVFLSPSVIENSSNSISEAMLLGMPIVASNVGGTSSEIMNGQEGLLYDLSNAGDMQKCISKIFCDNGLATRISANARQRAIKQHSILDCEKQYMDVYSKLSTCGIHSIAGDK